MKRRKKQKRSATLSDLGECRMLERLLPGLPARTDLRVGAGDDCAVVRPRLNTGFDWLLTSDPVIEGVHFDARSPAATIGHKALARCLSDLAAMGGSPLWALVNVSAPGATPAARIEGVYRGIVRLAKQHGMAIAGGDISAGPALALHVFVVGRAPAGRAALRSGAKPGDALYVTGALGGSSLGRHARFEPRLEQGQWLVSGRWVAAMMDLSDGLAMDLPRLLAASRCGAEINLAAIPLHADAGRVRDGRSALEHALCDGEDFELLFAVRRGREAAFESAWRRRFALPCTLIGRALAHGRGLLWRDASGKHIKTGRGGYEHFRG